MSESAVRVVVVHPDLMGTYGDGGNGIVLAQRLRWRGLDAELIEAPSDLAIPRGGDIYCLGGGEDGPQAQSASALAGDGALPGAVERGAVVLAVCAGFQVLGESFVAGGAQHDGLGVIDVRSEAGAGRRAVGELVSEPTEVAHDAWSLPALTGYENHAGVTTLGPSAAPLGRAVVGVGNGDGSGVDGARQGRVLATYMHGPVLARNPALADLVLSWVSGPLAPVDDGEVERLRAERLVAAGAASGRRRLSGPRRGRRRRSRRDRRHPPGSPDGTGNPRDER
jgi:lipid II isoglutaminyl synthase (glutamine-hydrolysing)